MDKRKMAHELQQLYILSQRISSFKEDFRYQNLYHGYLGEIYLDQLVQIFGEKFEYLDDLTLVFKETTVQIDKIFIVNNTIFLIDMKYYQGHYIFQNNNWYKNGKILLKNIFEQLRKAQRVVQNIFDQHHLPLKVEGVLAFMNPDATIEIMDNVAEKVLFYQDIPNWLYELNTYKTTSDVKNWKAILQHYCVPAFKSQKRIPIEDIKYFKKGICCRSCHGFQTSENHNFIVCSCGHREPKVTACARTICEFGVLFHDRELKRKELQLFFGDSINPRYLAFILSKYFPVAKRAGHMSTRKNKGILFEYWFEDEMDYFHSLEKS